MSSPGATVRRLRGGGKGWVLLTVAAGWFCINGFRVVLPALLPAIKADFTVGNAETGFALTVLWAAYAALQFPAGIIADRTGERALLVGGTALLAGSLAAFYLAPGFALFVVACAIAGVGAGLYGTPRDMLLSRAFEAADNTAYSITFGAGSLGAAALPVIATAIAARAGWRTAIVSLLPVVAVLAVGLWWVVPRRRGPDEEQGPSARTTARLALDALSDRGVVLASVGMILFIFTYQALIAFLPTYLVEVKGLSEGGAATLFGLLFVVGAVTQPLVGHLADTYGERGTMVGVVGLATATLVALPVTPRGPALLALVPLLGLRVSIGPVTSAYIVRDLPEAVQGTGWGLLRAVFFGLGATGSTVVGLFADAGLFDAAFLVLAALTAVIGPCWLLVPTEPRRGDS